MKHTLKLITLVTLGTLTASVSFAQNQPVQPATPIVTGNGTKLVVTQAQATPTPAENVGDGNAYEKTVTPLLREISRKKSILELKKLDKEIAKLDEVEKKDTPATPAGVVPFPTPQYGQNAVQNAQAPMSLDALPNESMSEVKVFMTYGDEEDLYAKIAVGTQGGYTVRKGDVLPDGRLVVKVNPNYIEVKKASTKKSKSNTEKIFLTANPVPQQSNQAQGQPQGQGQNQMPNPPSLMPIMNTNTATSTLK